MLAQDQAEVVNYSRDYLSLATKERRKRKNELTKHCQVRAARMLAILETIHLPTIEAVGEKGVQAISVLALHSSYSVMKRVLGLIKQAYELNQDSVDSEAIATLTDRIRIIEGKQQLYGTQWLPGENNKPFLYPIYKFATVNQLRSNYGLKAIRYPVNLANHERHPLTSKDIKLFIRQPTPKEFNDYISPYID